MRILAFFSIVLFAVPVLSAAPPIFVRGLEDLNSTLPSTGASHLTLSSDTRSYYTVISTGEINFRVAIDTGSADLFLLSSECTSDQCNQVPRYPLTYQSPTFVSVNDNTTAFNVSFLDHTVANGYLCRETITLANITLPNQAFGMITDTNITFVDSTSGVLGLGFQRLSTIPQTIANATAFFPRLVEDGFLAYPLFGINAALHGQGSLTLGAIDSSVVRNLSDIHWNDVVQFPPNDAGQTLASYLHWTIPLTSITVNNLTLTPEPTYPSITGSQASLALLDIGASGLYGPPQDVARLFEAIDSSRRIAEGLWAIPCDFTGPMILTFGSENYTLFPNDYLIGQAEGNPNLCLSWPIALDPSTDGIDWQMGAPFLRTVYSVYSYGINGKESPKVGLYRLPREEEVDTPEEIASYLSTASLIVPTTLPNQLLPSQSYSTLPYAFNSSVPAPTGGIVSSGLATSTYRPILQDITQVNTSALPTISPIPSIYTLVLTNSVGGVETITSERVVPSLPLGIPPEWNGGSVHTIPTALSLTVVFVSCVLVLWLS